jgi:8-oxo-dGTP diphosphatase
LTDHTPKQHPLDDDEARFLAAYRPGDYPRPAVTADVLCFTLDDELKVLLIKRGDHPCKGMWASPGGFVDVAGGETGQGEDVPTAAARELEEETSLPQGSIPVRPAGLFSRPGRDPRGRIITATYYAVVPEETMARVAAADDAAEARWFGVDVLADAEMAFDHRQMLDAALATLRRDLDDEPVVAPLLGEAFSEAELARVYAAVDPRPREAFELRFARLQRLGVICPSDDDERPFRFSQR